MIPILYGKNETSFEHNGIGHLRDATSCKVKEERNGEDELTLIYPIDGIWYSDIEEGCILKAKASAKRGFQLYRIYKSSKPMSGLVTFSARHISYDTAGLPIPPLTLYTTTAGSAMQSALDKSPFSHSFTAWSDIESITTVKTTKPKSARAFFGGDEESILSLFGGEFEWDNFDIKLHADRGNDNGVVIQYGKNLTDAKQERNIEECHTHIFPYAVKNENGTETTVMLSENVIQVIDPETIGHRKTLIIDLSSEFGEEEITEETLRKHTQAYIKSHDVGVPKVHISVSFEPLWQSPEYENIAPLEEVELCDTVTVYFAELGIHAKAKVIKTEYDVLAEKYDKIEIGEPQETLIDALNGAENAIKETKKEIQKQGLSFEINLKNAVEDATNAITGQSGGYVVLNPPKNPQEVLIMDIPEIESAVNIWRWNSGGLGHSQNGYNGPYGTAITQDGKIVADYITAGTLRAIDITSCTITAGTININDKFIVDTKGNLIAEGRITATSGTIGGCIIENGILQVPSFHITGTLKASQINVSELISAGGIAVYSDIPYFTSDLFNDSGYQTQTGVVSIINGTVTADYIRSIGITAENLISKSVDGKYTASIQNGHVQFTQDWSTYTTTRVASSIYDYFSSTRNSYDFFVGLGTSANTASVGWSSGTFIFYNANHAKLNGTWLGTSSEAITSDEIKKHDIHEIDERFSAFFDGLHPIAFKYNDGTSGRDHHGFSANEVEILLATCGIDTTEFAGFVRMIETDPETGENIAFCALRYDEFIPMLTREIQSLKARVKNIEDKLGD